MCGVRVSGVTVCGVSCCDGSGRRCSAVVERLGLSFDIQTDTCLVMITRHAVSRCTEPS